MRTFTPLQGQYLAYIDAYRRIHGIAPSEQDLERHFRVTPPSVHQMILTLARKGLIGRTAGAARSITLKVDAAELPALSPPEQKEEGRRVTPSRRPPTAPSKKKTVGTRRSAKPDPMDEYVDSPLMSQRLRYRDQLSARMSGRYGIYRTSVKQGRTVTYNCSCPSEPWPCKHARALLATWQVSPHTFVDLESCLGALSGYSKAQLLDAIAQLVLLSPVALSVMGIPGFEASTDASADDDDSDDLFDEE